ncbi:MAG: hypothetical protein PVH88_25320 [Ignavibacteria bacterium]|jgi:hypothetical protein
MNKLKFSPTQKQKECVSMAYLTYSGEKIIAKLDPKEVEEKIYGIINDTMPKIPQIDNNGSPDWKVVWGPTIYTFELAILQDNMMFVAQQISKPENYIVAVRGTNGLAMMDWIKEDFKVWEKVDWKIPSGVSYEGTPKISKATDNGIDALLHKMIPLSDKLPGYNIDITTFLKNIAAKKVNITFTGHSLGGALAPTLALWFKQSQNINGDWDPAGNAQVSTIPFAGATAGDGDFKDFFNKQLGDDCQRIHCNQDIVPHAWQTSDLKELPTLYSSAGIEMPDSLKVVLDIVELTVKGYEQVETSYPFDWSIDTSKDSYMAQAGYQHVYSYPHYLGVPELNTVIDSGKL